MKRRDFSFVLSGIIGGILTEGCSVKWSDESSAPAAKTTQDGSRFSRTSRVSGPSDLKTLSQLLQRAGYPLNSGQIEYLQKLEEGPEFTKGFREALDQKQIDAVETNLRSRRGRRR